MDDDRGSEHRPDIARAANAPEIDSSPPKKQRSAFRSLPVHERVAIVTGVVGVAVVAVSTCITAYQAAVMRRELNNTLDQQRAWVKIDAEPEVFLVNGGGAEASIRTKATNVGTVPAVGADVSTALWVAPGPHALNKSSPHPLQDNCPESHGEGTSIFPGETVELLAPLAEAPASDLSKLADDQGHVQVLAIVCVSYRSGVRQQIRHTISSFAIVRRTVNSGFANGDSKMSVSGEALAPPIMQLIRLGAHDEAD